MVSFALIDVRAKRQYLLKQFRPTSVVTVRNRAKLFEEVLASITGSDSSLCAAADYIIFIER
jgi:hypothetical protein